VALPGDRSQTVFIEASQHPLAQRLLQIYSLCGPAESHYHAHALRLNSEIPHGAIALRNVEGQEYFVTLNNYPLGTADPEEIRRSVLELALHADAVELALTGQDRH
jgi:serine/threonine-protein kinase